MVNQQPTQNVQITRPKCRFERTKVGQITKKHQQRSFLVSCLGPAFPRSSSDFSTFNSPEPKRSKSRSNFLGNAGPRTPGRTFIDVSLSFDRLSFNLSGISGELFEHFESAVDSLIKYARLTAMTNLCRRHSTAARWEPLWKFSSVGTATTAQCLLEWRGGLGSSCPR